MPFCAHMVPKMPDQETFLAGLQAAADLIKSNRRERAEQDETGCCRVRKIAHVEGRSAEDDKNAADRKHGTKQGAE